MPPPEERDRLTRVGDERSGRCGGGLVTMRPESTIFDVAI